jgi:hypothetical protein
MATASAVKAMAKGRLIEEKEEGQEGSGKLTRRWP